MAPVSSSTSPTRITTPSIDTAPRISDSPKLPDLKPIAPVQSQVSRDVQNMTFAPSTGSGVAKLGDMNLGASSNAFKLNLSFDQPPSSSASSSDPFKPNLPNLSFGPQPPSSQDPFKLNLENLSPLAPAAGRAVRGELGGLLQQNVSPFERFSGYTAGNFAGPDDLRLQQIQRAAQSENVGLVRDLSSMARENGLDDAAVYGRAKKPVSLFGKLNETPGSTVGSIKDLSGVRVDLNPTKPGFSQFTDLQGNLQNEFGDALQLKKNYIEKPNPWGYTGRIHSTLDSPSGLTHELQIGSRDLSQFIDKKLYTASGQAIELHDITGYKGQVYGVKLPAELEAQYPQLMRDITEANRTGRSVAQIPELAQRIDDFHAQAQAALPETLNKPAVPGLSRSARVGNVLSKGFGAVGAVGGAIQAANGVQELRQGRTAEGVGDIAVGSGSTVAGVAMMAGRVGLGTTTGGAVAVIDGAKDIYLGVRDGNVEQGVVGTVKAGAGTAMLAGVATANPILIAGGAITYGGAVIYENRDAIANLASSAWNRVSSWW